MGDILAEALRQMTALGAEISCVRAAIGPGIGFDHFEVGDEVAELLDKTGLGKNDREQIQRYEAALATLVRLGRAMGIHCILATQRPDAQVISGQIKNNIDFRVCGRADDVLSQIILDKTDANDLISKTAQGRFLTNTDVLFQAYYFDDKSDW